MTAYAVTRHEVSQTSLISVLAQGAYEGEMTLVEPLGYDSFGTGTFNGLDGETIILSDVYYRLRGGGSTSVSESMECTPYVVATNFAPSLSRSLMGPMTREEFSRATDVFVSSSNYMCVLWVIGRFAQVNARTVTKQDRPYRPMIEATDGEGIVRHEDFSRTIAGFRTPLYEPGVLVVGCHTHIVDDNHTWGGHLVDFVLEEGEAELCLGADSHMRPPSAEEFRIADLSEDMTEEIRRIEHH